MAKLQQLWNFCCGPGFAEEQPSKDNSIVSPGDAAWKQQHEKLLHDQQHIQAVEQQVALHASYHRTVAESFNGDNADNNAQHHDHDVSRDTIYAAPVDVDASFTPPVYAKTTAETQYLQQALNDHFIFEHLTSAQKDQLVNAFERKTCDSDTVLIQQGDVGDYFYLLRQGRVDFVDHETVVGKCYGPGGSFGELALLYHAPRAVTCVTRSSCEYYQLDQHTFRHLVAAHHHAHDERFCAVLRTIELFQHLDEHELHRFVNSMSTIHWKATDRIVQKGQVGTVFYIVVEGTVRIHDIGLGDSVYAEQTRGPGSYFGERALLTGELRAANVTAVTDVTTLAMDKDTLHSIIGDLRVSMERDMRRQFLASLPLFANVETPELTQLAACLQDVTYVAGTNLVETGQPYVMKLWIVRHGRLLVTSDKSNKIYNLQSGDYLGSKSIRGEPGHLSSHTASCETDVSCWVLTRHDLESVVGDVQNLGDTAAPRLDKKEDKYAFDLGDLRKHRLLGQGAFGAVWLVTSITASGHGNAYLDGSVSEECDDDSGVAAVFGGHHQHSKHQHVYALKIINKRRCLDAHQEQAVIREKEFLSLLQHPFLLHLVSSFQDEHNLFLVLPLVIGGELFARLHAQPGSMLSTSAAAFYAANIIEALGHLHARLIAYRDLKLENVLIDAHGYCRVVDLGFCKLVRSKTYSMVGTPEYLAPEIILSQGHDRSVDYWSFGVLLYELLCGASPFYRNGGKQMDMFKRIVKVDYAVPAHVDPGAGQLIAALLLRSPSQRIGNQSKGWLDIKNHPFFAEQQLDFTRLLKKDLKAPWTPPEQRDPLDAAGATGDTPPPSAVDNYGLPLSPEEQAKFYGF